MASSISQTSPENQAAWLVAPHSPLRVGPAETPSPGPDQILVKNRAIAINPVDYKIQSSLRRLPFILGEDIAGDVIRVGSSVTRFKPGDRVLSHVDQLLSNSSASGGFQFFTAAPSSTTAHIPSNISYTEACVLPLALDTAIVGLIEILGLGYPSLHPPSSGKTILVWGGASSVGAVTIQLAIATGAKVITTASKRNHELMRGLGVVGVVDYNDDDVLEQIKDILAREGGRLAGVYDSISTSESYRHTIPLANEANGGLLATVLPVPRHLPNRVRATMVLPIRPELQGPVWEEYVRPALEQGKLKCVPEPLVVGKGLESVQKGLETSKAGVSAKKVVVEL